jgi:predicted RNA-binding Zn ribbon-like protein
MVSMSLPSWVPEIETKPAPEPLLVVQAFVNTYEAETGIDQLADRGAAVRWFADAGLLDPPQDGANAVEAPGVEALSVDTVRAVRECLRTLLVHNGGGPPPDAAALAALRDLGGVPLTAALDGDGRVEVRPAGGTAWAGRLLLIVRDAQHEGTWARLKACRNDECQWAFYDRSHAGRGAWCDMAVCGNRIKNRNLRSRRAAATATTTTATATRSGSAVPEQSQ